MPNFGKSLTDTRLGCGVRMGSYFDKSPRLVVALTALMLGAANTLFAPSVMSSIEEWLRARGIFSSIVDAEPPHVETDEYGKTTEYPLSTSYQTRRFINATFPSIVINMLAGLAIGSGFGPRWIRYALLFSICYYLSRFLIFPLGFLILFTGFDAATPLDVWLQESFSFAIIGASAFAGAWIGMRRGKNRPTTT